jgi:uncharacterized membrane protein
MKKNHSCQLCGISEKDETLFPAELVRPELVKLIKEEHPDWNNAGVICMRELNKYRALYLDKLMKIEQDETTILEDDFGKSLAEYELLSENMNKTYDEKLTFGEKLADRIASFGGSWKFIILFGTVLFTWIIINAWLLTQKPFDPYPFILLNLILSCLAAIQAPVIMMSQNRHSEKEKLKSDYEYKINLKSELEIRHLNEKIDFLLVKQWQRLLEIQQFQTDLMEELTDIKRSNDIKGSKKS